MKMTSGNAVALLVLGATVLACTGEKPMETITPDQAAVAGIVESVGTLADRGEFDALARLYADEFTLDYSSLTGQPSSVKQPLELMAEWAGVLPGFDRTRHALTDVVAEISGESAEATANVVASHWIGDGFWQVGGHYDYVLSKSSGEWKITSMTFTLENEQGSRDVFGPAAEAARSKALPGHRAVTAERNKRAVRAFFETMEREDMEALVDMFADDGVQVNPYTGGVLPPGARGREALLAYWTPVPGNFDGMKFPIDELLATENPNIVFVRYRGEITLKNGAGVYRNNYYSTFRFDDAGKIEEYVEIFDPVVAARGFGLLEQLK